MERRFIAHRDYLANKANISCILERNILEEVIPRRLDRLEWVDEIPVDFSDYLGRECIPIGDLRWVSEWLSHIPDAADPSLTPLEIPDALIPFIHREYFWTTGADMNEKYMDGSRYFIKDIDTLKKWNSLLYEGNLSEFINPTTFYSVSEKVDFLSEWRVFVYEDYPRGACNYLGDPVIFPDEDTIYAMIRAMRNDTLNPHPRAYTLDVGVIRDDIDDERVTVPIEIHPFVACGLYGFSDRAIADMLVAGYEWYRYDAGRDVLLDDI